MPPPPVWAKPPFVLIAILVYLVVHFALRMAMWPTLGVDDSEQALFAQQFAWSYRNSAPPLFTWLLLGLGQVTAVNIVAISVLRYLLLGVVFTFSYLTARRLIADQRLAALSVYSFAAIYLFAFYSHHDLTHTTIMSAMLAVSWYVFVRLAESPRTAWYVTLGSAFGLGLLSKWNFIMFAGALPLACLARPSFRPLVLTWKILPALVVCALIVLPTVVAILFGATAGPETFQSVLIGVGEPYPARVLEGVVQLLTAALVYPQPLLPLVVLVFARPLWRGLRSAGPPTARVSSPIDAAFVGSTIAISLALHLALVLAFGAREFSERLMQPPLFILPVLLFMLVERGGPGRRAVKAFALLLLLLAAVALAARATVWVLGAEHCGSCRNMMPVEELAAELRADGYTGGGTILTQGFHVGGNMRVAFPAARVVSAPYPPEVWPAPRGSGQCLLLWQARHDPGMTDPARRFLLSYLVDRLGGDADAPHKEGVVSALMFGTSKREYRLRYRLYDGPVGSCR